MSAISITYNLIPPHIHTPEGLSIALTLSFPIKIEKEGQKAYYGALHDAIQEAKDSIDDDLTKWRDAVGKDEVTKEPKRKTGDEADEEDDEVDERKRDILISHFCIQRKRWMGFLRISMLYIMNVI
ncbi:hypothetical protein BDQ17DRAFT_1272886 [Cyathus striatus]|nr:hypothetical protein BDQ17DRAFT_1272886 [Cyathus striatus]